MSSEKNLLRRARKLEKNAFAAIYDEYSPGLYRYAFRQLGDQNLAEDCVAETFERFLKAVQHGKGPQQHLKAYLYRIAHNWITDSYRRQPPPAMDLEPEIHADRGFDPETTVFEQLEVEQIQKAIRLLTPEQRQVILLKFIEGWGNREIAEAIDKPVSAVKALQHRGLAALRRIMTAEDQETQ